MWPSPAIRKPASVSYGPSGQREAGLLRPVRPRAARRRRRSGRRSVDGGVAGQRQFAGEDVDSRSAARCRARRRSRRRAPRPGPRCVTTPSVPPYSSTTIARSAPRGLQLRPARHPGRGSPAPSTGSRAMRHRGVVVRRAERHAERVGHGDDAGDLVEGVLVHREAGCTRSAAPARARRRRWPTVGSATHIDPGGHRLGGPLVAESDRAPQQHRGVGSGMAPASRRDRRQQAQLLRRPGAGQLLAAARRRAGGPGSSRSRSAP